MSDYCENENSSSVHEKRATVSLTSSENDTNRQVEKETPSTSKNIVSEPQDAPSSVSMTVDPQAECSSNQSNEMVCHVVVEIERSDETPPLLQTDVVKMKKVSLYAEDKGPRMYNVKGNLVTPPLIPKNLTEAFSFLPIFGRPKNKAGLAEFQTNKLREFVGCDLDDQEFEELSNYCSPEHLKTGKELVMLNSNPGLGFFPSEIENRLDRSNENSDTPNSKLCLIQKHKLRKEKDVKNLYMKKMKYRGIRMFPLIQEDDNPTVTIGQPLQPGKDLIFRVRVYRPFSYSPKDKNFSRTRHSIFSCDVVVLGRHKLTALRDRIVCPNDLDMRVDVSDTPDELPHSSAKEVFPSGFLFINNVFYVDTRKGCNDYSAPLRQWAIKQGIGNFEYRDMCDVKLEDMIVKLGHPEVYVHQGNCEHLFTFSEIRLLNATDPLKLSHYPCHTAISKYQTVYCTTCAEFGAKWIVVGCSRVPFDPAFFCDKCFKQYLYKDGKKIGEFKAYFYRGNEINVLKPQG